jgi:oligopeptide transport system substrate-binding protein
MSFKISCLKAFMPLLLCLLPLLLASCNPFNGIFQPQIPVKAPLKQQIYTIPQIGISNLDTLDPALAHDAASMSAVQMLFTGLVSYNDQLQLQGQLAASWNVSTDGLTWTFHLKPHLSFSDGNPLTSTDVAYSLDRALQPTTQSTIAPLYLNVIKDANQLIGGTITTLIGDSITTPDPSTVVIQTSKPVAYFPALLTCTCADVVEKSMVNTYGKTFTDHLSQGGSSGPFRLARYVPGHEIEFVPNQHYYDAKPQLQQVYFVFYAKASDAFLAYQANKVDMTEIPLSALAAARNRSDFHQVPLQWINYYTMNYLTKPFDNIHIRQAFALAIDKQAIATQIWHGTAIPTNHIVPQGLPGYNPHLTGPDNTKSLSGDPAKAQALFKQGLHEEGYSSIAQLPTITLTYASGNTEFTQEVAALVARWKKVLGVTVQTNPVDYNTLLDNVTAATNNPQGIQFWGLSWVGEYPDPHDWLTLQFNKASPNNNMNYGQNQSTDAIQQQAVQQQLEKADATMQQATRLQLYQQSEQQLVNDVAWLPMEQMTNTFLRTPLIVGIVDNGQGTIPPDDWSKIYRVLP